MKKLSVALCALLVLAGCQETEVAENSEPIVRGLKTVVVKEQERTTVRRFPSVLQPSEITTLSFEIAGRLQAVDLKVGQLVAKDEAVAEIDPTSLDIQVQSAEAAVAQARSTANIAVEEFNRQEKLFDQQIIPKARLDQAQSSMETSAAALAQAEKQLESAKENLGKSVLSAPFDGIINSVEVESFQNIGAGAPILSIYSAEGFETAFSVSYDVINRIAVGKKVKVRLADKPDVIIDGTVTELGSRADTVSSFPIIVTLDSTTPEIKAGMAVEIAIELTVATGEGYTLPLTVLPMEGQIDRPTDGNTPGETSVFVYDAATSTVKRRAIKIGGVRENELIAVDGLNVGDRVASAGVSFLRDGQLVKLLEDGDK